jgi:membrane-bound ClpP family serine protease
MIALGVVLIVLGLLFPTVHVLFTIGIVLLVIGAVLWSWARPAARSAVGGTTTKTINLGRRTRDCSQQSRVFASQNTHRNVIAPAK